MSTEDTKMEGRFQWQLKDMLTENVVFLAAQTEEVKPRSNSAALKFLAPVNKEAGYYSKQWGLSLQRSYIL